ncbi:hypothetical protein QR680_001982 [Steinernema hermaphroditum]|uniref:Uncharacterized protein n=1 Tax=Steinernema hermaphroditum TaxID=289476 RepID=A0AA39LHB7_9BILA|nr:hypothetical protein QR680_001982 [Steinernema hermaphroditum]
MQMTCIFLYLILIGGTVGCFLSSCPYRRYGRNVRCSNCGSEMNGVCVAESVCCTSTSCSEDISCTDATVCPPRICKLAGSTGFCIAPAMCCTQNFCQSNYRCL